MKDLILSILNIFRYTGRIISIVRNTIVNTVFLFILAIICLSFFISPDETVKENSVLHLKLHGDIVEDRKNSAPIDDLIEEALGMEQQPREIVLQDILTAIYSAADDPSINVILLDFKGLGRAGLNQMQDIGKALNTFKEYGKSVIAAQDYYTQKHYYLASYADTIVLNPMGGVELHGFGVYPLYFKEALDKLQVNYHVFRVGTYKSAIEPITRNSMSDEARSQNSSWLNTLWANYIEDVERQRGLSPDTLTDYIENIEANLIKTRGDTALMALENRLVDKLFTREEFNQYLTTMNLGFSPNLVTMDDYLKITAPSQQPETIENNGISVIIAEGTIIGGDQPAGVIGSESLGDQLRDAREDDSIKGVVLRINSGGGSAFASEIIRQEILEIKKAGKPFVVSMGTMAASGGYWISADADQIWASPNTITGSIGIFGAIPTFERTLARVGIRSDGVGTTSMSSGMNLTQPLTPTLAQTIQLTVDNGYDRFLTIVHNGRNISRADLSLIGEGRVFSGEQAKELKLVDELGSLDEAIEATAQLAGLDSFVPVYSKRKSSMRDQILSHLTSAMATHFPDVFLSPAVKSLYNLFRNELPDFALMDDPHGIYARAMLQLSL
ncbi:signal peptide peptidase SppA [Desulfosediminicola flagellatus]|uniref:signal peptide peptidase SppA n=1 Tax=Desulfosediminicola flagellatus TaxID=2569541 RepID=UPI0010AD06E8|nr:signal peptide peptidase SppA [Desulfosediminicola flagellatus]